MPCERRICVATTPFMTGIVPSCSRAQRTHMRTSQRRRKWVRHATKEAKSALSSGNGNQRSKETKNGKCLRASDHQNDIERIFCLRSCCSVVHGCARARRSLFSRRCPALRLVGGVWLVGEEGAEEVDALLAVLHADRDAVKTRQERHQQLAILERKKRKNNKKEKRKTKQSKKTGRKEGV